MSVYIAPAHSSDASKEYKYLRTMSDMENVDTLSPSAVDEGCNTPTHTSVSDAGLDSDLPSYSSLNRTTAGTCPWKGGTFIIRDPETKLVIVLKEGVLGLCPQEKEHGGDTYHYGRGSHWHCVENEGMWLGFYNIVSGTYIGHNNTRSNWRFHAKARHHEEWEYFCVREHPDGGHVLLVKHWRNFLPMKVGGMENRELVVDAKTREGTAWEFIRVDSRI